MEARAATSATSAAPAARAARPTRAATENASSYSASKASPFVHVLAPPPSLAPFPRFEDFEQHSVASTKRKALDEVEEFLMESARDVRRSLQVPAPDKPITTEDMRLLFSRMEEVRLFYSLVSDLIGFSSSTSTIA